jgi:hypothetical protein
MTGILLSVAGAFLFLSAVLTAASTAVFSLSASRVRTLVD